MGSVVATPEQTRGLKTSALQHSKTSRHDVLQTDHLGRHHHSPPLPGRDRFWNKMPHVIATTAITAETPSTTLTVLTSRRQTNSCKNVELISSTLSAGRSIRKCAET